MRSSWHCLVKILIQKIYTTPLNSLAFSGGLEVTTFREDDSMRPSRELSFCILSVRSMESHRKRSHEEGRSSFLRRGSRAPCWRTWSVFLRKRLRMRRREVGGGGGFPFSFIPRRNARYPRRMCSSPPLANPLPPSRPH